MRRPNITSAIREVMRELKPDIETMLYGSEARGDAQINSDIDLLVLVNAKTVSVDDELKVIDSLYPIELKTGVSINPLILSREKWDQMVTPFSENVRKEAVLL